MLPILFPPPPPPTKKKTFLKTSHPFSGFSSCAFWKAQSFNIKHFSTPNYQHSKHQPVHHSTASLRSPDRKTCWTAVPSAHVHRDTARVSARIRTPDAQSVYCPDIHAPSLEQTEQGRGCTCEPVRQPATSLYIVCNAHFIAHVTQTNVNLWTLTHWSWITSPDFKISSKYFTASHIKDTDAP